MDNAKFVALKERGDKPDKKLQEQAKQYTVMNITLKSELPKLFKLTSKLIHACLERFVQLQMQWQDIWQIKIKQVLDNQQVPKNVVDIMAQFATDFQDVEGPVAALSITNGTLLAEKHPSKTFSSSNSTTADDLTLRPMSTHDSNVSAEKERIMSLNGPGRYPSSHAATPLSMPFVNTPGEIGSRGVAGNANGGETSYFPSHSSLPQYRPDIYAEVLRRSYQSTASGESAHHPLPIQSTGIGTNPLSHNSTGGPFRYSVSSFVQSPVCRSQSSVAD